MNKRDVTFLCFSRAPIDRLAAYKQRMGWQFPDVSTYDTDFPWDFGLAMTEEQANEIPEVKEMVDNPPEWLQEWAEQIGAELKDGLREGPGYIAFARENGTVYHTYTVMAPDPFVQPHFNMLLELDPEARARGAALVAQGRVPGLNGVSALRTDRHAGDHVLAHARRQPRRRGFGDGREQRQEQHRRCPGADAAARVPGRRGTRLRAGARRLLTRPPGPDVTPCSFARSDSSGSGSDPIQDDPSAAPRDISDGRLDTRAEIALSREIRWPTKAALNSESRQAALGCPLGKRSRRKVAGGPGDLLR